MKYFLTTITLFLTLNNANAGLFSKDKVVDYLQQKNGIFYEVNAEQPFTGKLLEKNRNGQKRYEGNFENGKPYGLTTWWHENGQKRFEGNFENGERVSN